MFERFTEAARQVIVLAQEEARILKHNFIGTEHFLLGLLREEEGIAVRALESLDVTVEKARAEIVRVEGSGEELTKGQIPFTPRAKKVLEFAQREAISLGYPQIDTEHLLLGLMREGEGVAVRVLLDLGVTADAVRERMIPMMRARRTEPTSVQPPEIRQPAPSQSPTPQQSREVALLLEMAAREAQTESSPEIRLRHLVRALAEFFGR